MTPIERADTARLRRGIKYSLLFAAPFWCVVCACAVVIVRLLTR